MPNNKETDLLLREIEQLLAEDESYPLNGTLLYARVASNSVAPSIFKDAGNQVVFRWPDLDRLGGALLDLWEAEEPDRRWAEIVYVIRDEKFEVEYMYADEIDSEEELLERRERVVRRYFGKKIITYPTFPEDDRDSGYNY